MILNCHCLISGQVYWCGRLHSPQTQTENYFLLKIKLTNLDNVRALKTSNLANKL